MPDAIRSARGEREPGVRVGIALCLSGGGFRALLFHLGALRRLNELGVLERIDTFSATSGGSLLAARIATRIANGGSRVPPLAGAAFTALVEEPLVALAIRGLSARVRARRWHPRNWFRWGAGPEALAETLEEELTALRLGDLPAGPRFVFCSADRLWGIPWTFERERMGHRKAGWAPTPPDLPLARAVAASACHPHAMSPLPAPLDPSLFADGETPPGRERDAALRRLRLEDGSGYSHLGLEPVWSTHATVLVSEAGARPEPGRRRRRERLPRPEDRVADDAGRSLRERRLVSGFAAGTISGTNWSLSSAPSSYGAAFGYSKELARDVLCGMRCGLDPVSAAEAGILRNHGYLTADAAVRRHAPGLLPRLVPSLRLPSPAWSPADPQIEIRVREAMAESGRRRGRG
jgi:NTE family protein